MYTSEYDPIWEALKASPRLPKTTSITANKILHNRILKAVKKRKWLDIGYKIQIDPKVAKLTHKRDGSKLTFILTFHSTHATFNLGDL